MIVCGQEDVPNVQILRRTPHVAPHLAKDRSVE